MSLTRSFLIPCFALLAPAAVGAVVGAVSLERVSHAQPSALQNSSRIQTGALNVTGSRLSTDGARPIVGGAQAGLGQTKTAGQAADGAVHKWVAGCTKEEAARVAVLAEKYECPEGTEQRVIESDLMKEVGCTHADGKWEGLARVWRKNSPERIVSYEAGEDRGYVQLWRPGSPSMIGEREGGKLVCRRGWNADGSEVEQVRVPQ